MGGLHYYVHGNGRGHASRTRPVLERLRDAGHSVRVLAGGQALDALLEAGERVEAMELASPGRGLPLRFVRRVRQDRARMAERPALVITDGDGPSMHAARSLGIPVVAVGHGLLFAHCDLPLSLSLTERVRESLNARSASWLAQRRIVSHFGTLVPRDRRTVVARPDPRGLQRRPGEHLLVYGGRDDLSAWVQALHARGHALRVFGRARALPPGVRLQPPGEKSFAEALEGARGVVGTAGSNLVSEAFELGRPMLALYPEGLLEQRVNAQLAEREGLAVSACSGRLDASALDRFETLLATGSSHYQPPPTPTVSEAVCRAVGELLG